MVESAYFEGSRNEAFEICGDRKHQDDHLRVAFIIKIEYQDTFEYVEELKHRGGHYLNVNNSLSGILLTTRVITVR